MGSWCDLFIAGHSVASMKSLVDPDVMTLFGRDDRRVCVRLPSEVDRSLGIEVDDDEEITVYEYCSTAREVADRLDVMGFTLQEAEEWFAYGTEYEAEMHQRWHEIPLQHQRGTSEAGADERPSGAISYSEFLRGLEFEEWLDAVRQVLGQRKGQRRGQKAGEAKNRVLAYVRGEYGFGDELFGFPNASEVDFRTIVRALLEAIDPKFEVVLNYTDLVGGGWYSEEDDVRELALQNLREEYVVSERLIILTEGSSDAEVMRKTLEVRYPHLKDYVAFPDFHGSNAEGGTGALVNLVKGFASSGVPNRIVALFDNDAAGDDARRKLDRTALPDNMRVLSLPPLEYAESYPTVGPQGRAEVDVNGCACSLELYFGRDVLEDAEGNLAPVEWSGRVQALDRYQGAVVGKATLRHKYLATLSQAAASCKAYEQHDWEPMESIFEVIFEAFEH